MTVPIKKTRPIPRFRLPALAASSSPTGPAEAERAADDDERSIEDSRVQHRSYTFAEANNAEIPYALFVPSTYDPAKKSPLMLALHGLDRQYDWLMGYHGLLDRAEKDGFIVATALGYTRRGWYGSRDNGKEGELSEKDVMNVFELARKEFNIDENRMYLWGHSMGGAGTYHLAAKHPGLWAALAVAAPAPSTKPEALRAIAHIPILVLQGDQDGLVDTSRQWVAQMGEIGMQHIYVEVPGGDHALFISQNEEMVSKLFSFFDIVRKMEPPAE
ncbi:MAG: alpha/beta hydrolase [Candidatus Hydrogenedentes bacterium]|jgi:predicted peptidase|nr:alpha/beta hydrolase [Candidatus Hydrogenedentota bacterium]